MSGKMAPDLLRELGAVYDRSLKDSVVVIERVYRHRDAIGDWTIHALRVRYRGYGHHVATEIITPQGPRTLHRTMGSWTPSRTCSCRIIERRSSVELDKSPSCELHGSTVEAPA